MNLPRKIAVIGLGYVGLLATVLFARKYSVVAFDTNPSRIDHLRSGHDTNNEVNDLELQNKNICFTNNTDDLKEANFYIVAVPTPLDKHKNPDLSILLKASETIAKSLKKEDIIVYESSVYPGAIENECIPFLEEQSKMKCGVDFYVGYSPERINPGDKIHTIESIPKIVSAINEKSLDTIANVYSSVIKAGVFAASNIRTAEAIKIVENVQRDINIAYMNEIAILLHQLDIDTSEVIEGMKNKWNYLPFLPGLVGGHCIAVNPYYLAYIAEKLQYQLPLVMAARHINEDISKFIVIETIKKLTHLKVPLHTARIAIFGLTYKEDCSDIRDTRVIDIIKELEQYGCSILVHDPLADTAAAKRLYGIDIKDWKELIDLDAIIISVPHKQYLNVDASEFKEKLNNYGLIVDIKEMIDPKQFSDSEIIVWKL